ncbi:MAG: Na+/H+ antiporter NhaC family protein [Pseudomonadota bacterium]|nr:Na+/H+ antiporter NhaC family protein [Pseudomonadota bacterium]
MNSVLIAVCIMLALSLARVHVVIALIIATFAGGLLSGLGTLGTLNNFNSGLGAGATVALSYAFLGAFAVAISRSGIPDLLAGQVLKKLDKKQGENPALARTICYGVMAALLVMAVCSQNLIPIHIAFIPLLVPPLLLVTQKLKLDRRAIACVLTFGLITPYMFLPVGFGSIYLNDILLVNLQESGADVSGVSVIRAMALPALGMLAGLLVAVFISYRKPREYSDKKLKQAEHTEVKYSGRSLAVSGVAVITAFVVQLMFDSMVLGALVGFVIFSISGVIRWKQADDVFVEGMKMMANVGFIMITASGFAAVMRATGDIQSLVDTSAALIDNSKALGALMMLLVGLVITLGVGSSFSTVPIIAAIFVPLALQLGFSPLAIVTLVGTAGALGDAGSPASDSTLGPTAGLNADGQHNHIWDTVVPTFLHYNLPLLAGGWVAAMLL